MAVTRSTPQERAGVRQRTRQFAQTSRSSELAFLTVATVFVLAAAFLVYKAKVGTTEASKVLNLNQVTRREQLLPYLSFLSSQTEQQFFARRLFDHLQEHGGKMPNVGSLGRIQVSGKEVRGNTRLTHLRERAPKDINAVFSLLSPGEVRALKPYFSVRRFDEFRWKTVIWLGLLVLSFFLVHLLWTVRGFDGNEALLPIVYLLTGTGFSLILSLRDPVRDTLSAVDFAQSAVMGAMVLAAASLIPYPASLRRLSYVPLLASFVLSVALIVFGSGPGSSDAKVNLLGFQPVELIKILLVLFLAGYFATRWELLRALKERRPELNRVSKWVEVPRLEYVVPVVGGVALALLFFFFQRDLGPALVITCLFLLLYAVARERYLLAASGFVLMLCGFAVGYLLRTPATVYSRVQMWLSPWDNSVRGGEQVVHALWAFATGGVAGTGLGLGDPDIMPAAHTDLILAVLGEEWGFLGVAAVFCLYALLIATGIRIAFRAKTDWAFFAALGFTLLLALEILLIAGGVLGLVPLSGVVTPFLSYGGTAMLANSAIAGFLLALSRETGASDHTRPFLPAARSVAMLIGVLGAAVAAKAAYIQLFRANATVGAGTLTLQADGQRRFQYNPRLTAIARSIPRGTIYDRRGVPLATADWKELESKRTEYQRMGIVLPPAPLADSDARYYPLGAITVHLTGDLRTRANWGARNSSLEERDSAVRLQGYDDRARVVEVPDPRTGKPTYTIQYDYRELVPLLRHRYQPDHPDVKRVRERERDLKMSIDARLQWRAADILRNQLKRLGKERGAVVAIDPRNGDLLASVSYPWPTKMPPDLSAPDSDEAMLDRARYGIYPPGSTFKIVTALAALRANPALHKQQFECRRLPDGRVGNYIKGWSRPIRDDVADRSPHGHIAMDGATVVSCNAYFAQLATYKIGPQMLLETAGLFGINVASPNTPARLKDALPQAAYGQGQVVATPLQMARVAAAVAAGGKAPQGRWIIDETNQRVQPAKAVASPQIASLVAADMRRVVTSGTGRNAAGAAAPIAGKTGTAEVEREPSHAWFIGFAPAQAPRIAFAVLIENGQYGGSAAAPVAAQVVSAAEALGLLGAQSENSERN